MSGKIVTRAIATFILATLPIVGITGTASATTNLRYEACHNAQAAVGVACTKLGDWYEWGATGPNRFDCSGLTQYAVRHGDHRSLPRTAQEQRDATRWISWQDRRPGDLVFFASGGYTFHVGIYVGTLKGPDGRYHSYMIAAPKTGEQVHIEQIFSNYWSFASISFGRVK